MAGEAGGVSGYIPDPKPPKDVPTAPRQGMLEMSDEDIRAEADEMGVDFATMKRFYEWKMEKERGHPLYEPSSSEIGKLPMGHKMVYERPKAGRKAGFSKTAGAMASGPRDTGLRTGITRHRFLKELDGIVD